MSCTGNVSLPPRQIELMSLTCYPQVFQWMSPSWNNLITSPVCEASRSLKKLCILQANPEVKEASLFFWGQPFFHQIDSYLPVAMLVMMSPRVLNFQWKTKWIAKPLQALLVLSKMGPEEREKPGLMGTDLVPLGGAEHQMVLLLGDGKTVMALPEFSFPV